MKRIKTLVAVAFLLGCSVTVNAQLGGLVKNAKKAVKEKVEKKVKDAKNEVENTAENKAMETAGLEKG